MLSSIYHTVCFGSPAAIWYTFKAGNYVEAQQNKKFHGRHLCGNYEKKNYFGYTSIIRSIRYGRTVVVFRLQKN